MVFPIHQTLAAPLFDIQCKKWILFTLTFNKYIILLVKAPISIVLKQATDKQEQNCI